MMKIERQRLIDGNIEFWTIVDRVQYSINFDTTTEVFYLTDLEQNFNQTFCDFMNQLKTNWRELVR